MEFREKVKRQNVILWIALFLTLALNVALGELGGVLFLDYRQMTPPARNLQRAMYFGFLVYLIVRLAGNRKLLRERERLEERERRELDERRQLISASAGKLSADLFTVGLALAVFAASLLDMAVFTTLAWVLLVWAFLRLAAFLLQSRKY